MSALKQAITKAVERRHAPPVPVHAQDAVPAQPVDTHKHGAKRAALALEELRSQPHSTQLNALRSHFESCITQPSRYVDQQQLSRWTRGSRRTDRAYSTAVGSTAAGVRWSKDLESDIGSVVTEAGLSAAASAAVVDAAKKGAIADNPGVLLCQIMALQSALGPPLGQRAVTSLIRTMPTLLNTSSDTLAWHYEELVAMFGPEPAASLPVKAPFVLCMAPFMTWSKLTNIQSLLGASVEQAKTLVLRQPRLLAMAHSALESRLRELQSLARLDDKPLRRLVTNQPALLSYMPATLASNMAAMARCLGTTEEHTAKLLSRSPTLLMLSPSTVSAKIAAIASLLDCTPAQATAVVTSQPTVLSVSSELLAQKLTQVGAALDTSHKATAQLMRSNPNLLTLSSSTLARKLGKLQDAVAAALAAEDACGLLQPLHLHHHHHHQQQQQQKQQHEPHTHTVTSQSHSATTAVPLGGGVGAEQARASAHHIVLYPPASPLASTTSNSKITTTTTSSSRASSSSSPYNSSRTTTKSSSTKSSARAPLPSTLQNHHNHPHMSFASAWLQQLHNHSPQQRASLACFSEARYTRLPTLAAAHAAARMGVQQGVHNSPVQQQQQSCDTEQQQQQQSSNTEQQQSCNIEQQQQGEECSSAPGHATASITQQTSTGSRGLTPGRTPESKEAAQAGVAGCCREAQGSQQVQGPSGMLSASEAGSSCREQVAGCSSRSGVVAAQGEGSAGRSSIRPPSLASVLRMTEHNFQQVLVRMRA